MVMLSWMYGETKQDRIRNDDIKKSWGSINSIKDDRDQLDLGSLDKQREDPLIMQ